MSSAQLLAWWLGRSNLCGRTAVTDARDACRSEAPGLSSSVNIGAFNLGNAWEQLLVVR